MSRRPKVWLIDGHYQIFRAYYSMPDLRAPDGTPVGAFRGYASTLIKFVREEQPTHVGVAWDHAMTSFRNELWSEYKAGRTEAPDDLEPQFGLCAEVTRALGLPVYSLERFEADDVIATMTRKLLAKGADVVIVTADKDLGALVSDRVRLYDLKKQESQGPDELRERMGVPPERISEFLALVGDAVDNVPGVAGIGAKTGAALLNHFGSLADIPSDFEDWKELELRGKRRAFDCLAAGTEQLELSQRLVELQRDLPVDVKLRELQYRGARREPLEELLGRLGADALLDRVTRFAS
ncbi:MAG: flap endonuclease [Deltaproteobacteria bacterium]|nr:flap endonuclease [Deltaproteobacteria bacterium]MBW2413192.1 flap endonuclease [Deltaproteobacteria bacterium]